MKKKWTYLLRVDMMDLTPWTGVKVLPTKNVTSQRSGISMTTFRASLTASALTYFTESASSSLSESEESDQASSLSHAPLCFHAPSSSSLSDSLMQESTSLISESLSESSLLLHGDHWRKLFSWFLSKFVSELESYPDENPVKPNISLFVKDK